MKETVTAFNLEAAFKALDEIEIPSCPRGIKANKANLKEAFNKKQVTDYLIEDYYDVNDQDDLAAAHDQREDEIAKAKLARIEKIVDLDASSADELLSNYTGKVIIQCPQCMTLFYKNPEDIEESETDPNVVNVSEVCQHCGNDSGYTVIGKVAAVEDDELQNFESGTETEEPTEEEVTEEETTEDETADEGEEVESEEELEDIDLDLDQEEESEETNESLKTSLMEDASQNNVLSKIYAVADSLGIDLDNPVNENLTEDAEIEAKLKAFADSITADDLIDDIQEDVEQKETLTEAPSAQAILDKLAASMGIDNLEGDSIQEEELDEAMGDEISDEEFKAMLNDPVFMEEGLEEKVYNKMLAKSKAQIEEGLIDNISDAEFEKAIEVLSGKTTAEKFNDEETLAEIEGAEVDNEINVEDDVDLAEDDLDDIDEVAVEECVTESLTNVYENVKSFKLTDCAFKNGNVIIEGVIKFNSGAQKATKYEFLEAKVNKTTGSVKMTGINENLGNGTFTLTAQLTDKCLYTESFDYRYSIGKSLVEGACPSSK